MKSCMKMKPLKPVFYYLVDCNEYDVNYSGNNVKSGTSNNEWECQKMCQENSKCQFWTFVKAHRKCWLKDAKSASKSNGLVSGPKLCIGKTVHGLTNGGGVFKGPHILYTTSTNYNFVRNSLGKYHLHSEKKLWAQSAH